MSNETRMNLTRRDFLKWTGVGTAGVAAMLGLAACGEEKGNPTTAGSTTVATTPTGTTAGAQDTTAGIPTAPSDAEEMSPILNNPLFRPGRVDMDNVPTGIPSARDTMVIRLDNQPGTLENQVGGGGHPQGMFVWCLTGCGLVVEGYTNGGVDFMTNKYSLLDSFEYDEDYMGVTMHIRDTAFFHSGAKVTADDLYFSIWLCRNNHRNKWIIWDDTKVVDANTVHLRMSEVNIASLTSMMGRTVRTFEKKLYEEAEAKDEVLSKFMYGTLGSCGPYIIDEWVDSDHIKMHADPGFYVPANIPNVTVRYIVDNTVAFMEMTTGAIDLMYSPAATDLQDVLEGKYGDQFGGIVDYSDQMMMMGFNISGVMGDRNLRWALIYAIDWASIIDTCWGYLGSHPQTPMAITMIRQPNISEWWEEKAPAQPEKAKEYLAKTQYPNGGLTLTCLVNQEETKRLAAEMINKNLEAIGMKLEIKVNDTATYDALMRDPDSGWDLWIRDFGGTGSWASFMKSTGTMRAVTHADKNPEEKAAADRAAEIGDILQNTADDATWDKLANEMFDMYKAGEILYWFPMVATNNVVICDAKLRNWYRSTNNWYMSDAYFKA